MSRLKANRYRLLFSYVGTMVTCSCAKVWFVLILRRNSDCFFFFVDATLDSYVHCYMVRHRLSNIPLWLRSEMRTHIQQVQTACSHFVENASVFLEVFRGTLVRHVTFFAKTAKQHKCRVEKHQVYFCVDSAPPIHTVTWASGGVSSRHITWSPDESTAMSFAFAVTPCIDILKTPTQLPVAPSLVCILWS